MAPFERNGLVSDDEDYAPSPKKPRTHQDPRKNIYSSVKSDKNKNHIHVNDVKSLEEKDRSAWQPVVRLDRKNSGASEDGRSDKKERRRSYQGHKSYVVQPVDISENEEVYKIREEEKDDGKYFIRRKTSTGLTWCNYEGSKNEKESSPDQTESVQTLSTERPSQNGEMSKISENINYGTLPKIPQGLKFRRKSEVDKKEPKNNDVKEITTNCTLSSDPQIERLRNETYGLYKENSRNVNAEKRYTQKRATEKNGHEKVPNNRKRPAKWSDVSPIGSPLKETQAPGSRLTQRVSRKEAYEQQRKRRRTDWTRTSPVVTRSVSRSRSRSVEPSKKTSSPRNRRKREASSSCSPVASRTRSRTRSPQIMRQKTVEGKEKKMKCDRNRSRSRGNPAKDKKTEKARERSRSRAEKTEKTRERSRSRAEKKEKSSKSERREISRSRIEKEEAKEAKEDKKRSRDRRNSKEDAESKENNSKKNTKSEALKKEEKSKEKSKNSSSSSKVEESKKRKSEACQKSKSGKSEKREEKSSSSSKGKSESSRASKESSKVKPEDKEKTPSGNQKSNKTESPEKNKASPRRNSDDSRKMKSEGSKIKPEENKSSSRRSSDDSRKDKSKSSKEKSSKHRHSEKPGEKNLKEEIKPKPSSERKKSPEQDVELGSLCNSTAALNLEPSKTCSNQNPHNSEPPVLEVTHSKISECFCPHRRKSQELIDNYDELRRIQQELEDTGVVDINDKVSDIGKSSPLTVEKSEFSQNKCAEVLPIEFNSVKSCPNTNPKCLEDRRDSDPGYSSSSTDELEKEGELEKENGPRDSPLPPDVLAAFNEEYEDRKRNQTILNISDDKDDSQTTSARGEEEVPCVSVLVDEQWGNVLSIPNVNEDITREEQDEVATIIYGSLDNATDFDVDGPSEPLVSLEITPIAITGKVMTGEPVKILLTRSPDLIHEEGKKIMQEILPIIKEVKEKYAYIEMLENMLREAPELAGNSKPLSLGLQKKLVDYMLEKRDIVLAVYEELLKLFKDENKVYEAIAKESDETRKEKILFYIQRFQDMKSYSVGNENEDEEMPEKGESLREDIKNVMVPELDTPRSPSPELETPRSPSPVRETPRSPSPDIEDIEFVSEVKGRALARRMFVTKAGEERFLLQIEDRTRGCALGDCGRDSYLRCLHCRAITYCSVDCARVHYHEDHRQHCEVLKSLS